MECFNNESAKPSAPLGAFIKRIEEAFDSGELRIAYYSNEITRKDIEKAFQDRLDGLHKIRRLAINAEDLPAAALLFETAKIEELEISIDIYIEDETCNKEVEWPSFLEKCDALTKLALHFSKENELPSWVRNAPSLRDLSVCEIKNASLPDWLGDLQSLTKFSLFNNENLETLPDSMGNLKNLAYFSVNNSPIEKLPDTIVNCSALKSVDIFGTKIASVPDFISSVKWFNDNTIIDVIPTPTGLQGQSISYKCFCNSYYRLAEAILRFHAKARREGLLAMEEDLEHFTEGFFKEGIRLVVDGTDGEIIRRILQTKSEREHDFYRKKLFELATEGILCIQAGDPELNIVFLLASLVDIKNNPLDAACAKYLAGDNKAISNIDFKVAIEPEEEREELRFIKRAMNLNEVGRKGGFLALREHLDREGIAKRDVFEYGLAMAVDHWDACLIRKILDNLIEHEVNPLRKNLAQAKEEALLSINAGDNPKVLRLKLCAFFDVDIAGEIRGYYESITNESVS